MLGARLVLVTLNGWFTINIEHDIELVTLYTIFSVISYLSPPFIQHNKFWNSLCIGGSFLKLV